MAAFSGHRFLSNSINDLLPLITMNNIELVRMDPGYRKHLKRLYYTPLLWRISFCFFFLIITHALILASGGSDGLVTTIIVRTHRVTLSEEAFFCMVLASFLSLGCITIKALFHIGRHYYEDYRFGYIVKESVSISKVMETPAGINICWTDSKAIFTFIPEPLQNLLAGIQVYLFYLQHSKEYLKYELQG